jgi:hypothetical protein
MHLVDFLFAEDFDGSAFQWKYTHYVISSLKSPRSFADRHFTAVQSLTNKIAHFFRRLGSIICAPELI